MPSPEHLPLIATVGPGGEPSAVIREKGRYKGEEPGASLEPICSAFSTTINSSSWRARSWGQIPQRAPSMDCHWATATQHHLQLGKLKASFSVWVKGTTRLFTGQLFRPYPTFHMDMYVNDSQWTGDEEA
ncbi:unnamed protein product [Gadus morhua 'NCC']